MRAAWIAVLLAACASTSSGRLASSYFGSIRVPEDAQLGPSPEGSELLVERGDGTSVWVLVGAPFTAEGPGAPTQTTVLFADRRVRAWAMRGDDESEVVVFGLRCGGVQLTGGYRARDRARAQAAAGILATFRINPGWTPDREECSPALARATPSSVTFDAPGD